MEEVLLFFLTFLVSFLYYQLFIVRRAKKMRKNLDNKKKKKEYKELLEISYLVSRYSFDLDKISYDQLLQIVSIVSSLDIAIVVTIILLVPNFLLEIVIGLVSMILLIMISYHFVYLFYKKKGMIKK